MKIYTATSSLTTALTIVLRDMGDGAQVFRNMRHMWGVNDAEYMLSLGGSSALRQLNSPGKSGEQGQQAIGERQGWAACSAERNGLQSLLPLALMHQSLQPL